MGIGALAASAMQLAQAVGGAAKVFHLLEREPAILTEGGDRPAGEIEGTITFTGVTFKYPTRPDVPVLDGFNLTVPALSTTALVGTSGCGKSTTISLLLRFYDTSAGVLAIDGMDIKRLSPSWVRAHMALVQQEPVLFGVSIRENVAYALNARSAQASNQAGGKPASPASDVAKAEMQLRIEAACIASNAHSFVSEFVEGYDTLVGERGTRLSGGQKQRIAIARALIAEPKVLLLDEATSALDAESEGLVQAAIDRVSSGRTVLVIAHRLSTIRQADQIAVVHKGEVVESGTHDELTRSVIKGEASQGELERWQKASRPGAYMALVQRQMEHVAA